MAMVVLPTPPFWSETLTARLTAPSSAKTAHPPVDEPDCSPGDKFYNFQTVSAVSAASVVYRLLWRRLA
jgi:hypothetical protein